MVVAGDETAGTVVDGAANTKAAATANAPAIVNAGAMGKPESATKVVEPTARLASSTTKTSAHTQYSLLLLCSANLPCRISLYGGPIMPFLTDQQIRDGEGFGIPERVPWNGYVVYPSCFLFVFCLALMLRSRSFAGQNEPISGQGGPQNE